MNIDDGLKRQPQFVRRNGLAQIVFEPTSMFDFGLQARIEEAIAVSRRPASLTCAIERQLGAAQQLMQVGAVAGIERDPESSAERDRSCLQRVGQGQFGQSSLGARRRQTSILSIRHDLHEFVAADAREEIVGLAQ